MTHRLPTVLASLLLALALVMPPATAHAGWLSRIAGGAEHAATRAARAGAGTLEHAAAHVKALPAATTADRAILAAQATQEGHWRFVNRAGETFTAGTPDEIKRVASVLLPDARPDAHLTLYVTQDTLFANRAALKVLPKGTGLNVVVGEESYAVIRRGDGPTERLFAEVRPGLVVELTEPRAFSEAVWQLARPLNKANVRVLALEPGGPPQLASAPRIDPATRRALIDTIDPASLGAALGTIRGQTALVTGRIDGTLLYVKPSSGPERSLILADLFKAAESADVNLVVLHAASTPRQPGGRNWLWQKVQVKGLDEALGRARVADFIGALGASNGSLAVTATPTASGRTLIEMRPAADLPGSSVIRPIGDILTDLAGDLTGRVAMAGVQANVRSAERQRELDQRLIPGIPADLQLLYLGLALLGLFGVPVSRDWWRRLWPPEVPSDYDGRAGYRAARLVRGLLFLALFLPLTAPVAAPYALYRQMVDVLMAPVRLWRWLTGRRAEPAAR